MTEEQRIEKLKKRIANTDNNIEITQTRLSKLRTERQELYNALHIVENERLTAILRQKNMTTDELVEILAKLPLKEEKENLLTVPEPVQTNEQSPEEEEITLHKQKGSEPLEENPFY